MSSSLLSTPYGRPARIIRIMEPSAAFAHKIAAWNERELMRDLYDIYQYETVFGISPNMGILELRLKKARSYANIKAAKDLSSLSSKLGKAAAELNESALQELEPLLSAEELAGLGLRMKPALKSLIIKLATKP